MTSDLLSLRFGLRYQRVYRWFLSHPSKASWIVVELFLRRLPLRRRFANAWWQFRHYGHTDAFDALWQTWEASRRD